MSVQTERGGVRFDIIDIRPVALKALSELRFELDLICQHPRSEIVITMPTILEAWTIQLLFFLVRLQRAATLVCRPRELEREVLARPGRTPVRNKNLAGENCAASSASCARTPGVHFEK
jgi:hypothetical protein